MLPFNIILDRIEQEISELHFNNPPQNLYQPIEYILSLGGKRIRPALALMACDLYEGNIDKVIKPALAIEVFHNFTLLHDDLMDEADKRRGKPTVHKLWNTNTAILSGDAMLIASYRLMEKTDPEHLSQAMPLFSQTALEICAGQQYDMDFEQRTDVTEEEYIEMIRLKTAVLLAASLKMGALIARAPSSDANHLYDFGINIGLAFQLQDDLLDTYGDTKTFGKNTGGDILCDKKTFLLINALKKATPEQRNKLEEWMGKSTGKPAEKISVFTEIYNQLGLKELTEKRIHQYHDNAMNCLKELTVAAGRLQIIKEVADRLMYRQF